MRHVSVGGGHAHAVAVDRQHGPGGSRGLGLSHRVHDEDLVADDHHDGVAEPMAGPHGSSCL